MDLEELLMALGEFLAAWASSSGQFPCSKTARAVEECFCLFAEQRCSSLGIYMYCDSLVVVYLYPFPRTSISLPTALNRDRSLKGQ